MNIITVVIQMLLDVFKVLGQMLLVLIIFLWIAGLFGSAFITIWTVDINYAVKVTVTLIYVLPIGSYLTVKLILWYEKTKEC